MTVALENATRVVGAVPFIRDVSLTLEPGTLSVLLGPTLAGKTSLMRLLAGLDPPTTGRVVVNGKDVTGIDVRKRSVAMVYQQFVNYPSLTVFENIASPLRVQGRPNEEVERRVGEVASLLRLEPYLDRLPLALSGGQQQRTAIARALVKGADLVLLDEPLANLDYKLREELRTELPRIFEVSGAIFVYATTEPSEALLLGGRTICLSEGRALQVGGTASVYRRPDSLRVAELFSANPVLNSLVNWQFLTMACVSTHQGTHLPALACAPGEAPALRKQLVKTRSDHPTAGSTSGWRRYRIGTAAAWHRRTAARQRFGVCAGPSRRAG
jgi:glycerol transport system ATP-binding protein